MKPIILIHVVFCLVFCGINNTCGQNLVPNPSFEEYTICPYNYFMLPNDWYTCSADPDYFNACNTTGYMDFSVPQNCFGYQEAADGNAYCGFYALCYPGLPAPCPYKEYLGCTLENQLTIGQKYYISFKVSYAGSVFGMAINNIGLLFSTVSFQDNDPYDTIWGIPTNNLAHVNDTFIITDSQNWTMIKGTIVADSAYQYIIIGDFFDVAHTDTILYTNSPNQQKAYYFLDEVCVSTDSATCWINTTTNDKEKTKNEISVIPNPFNDIATILVNEKIKNIRIFDFAGRNVTSDIIINNIMKVNHSEQCTINKGKLLAGIYILKITTENKTISTKLIITN